MQASEEKNAASAFKRRPRLEQLAKELFLIGVG